jgi:transposase-like protein
MGKRATFETASPEIIGCLRAGASIADAARKVGAKERTVKQWLTNGRRDPKSKYGIFAETADAIRAERDEPLPDDQRLSRDDVMRHLEEAIMAGSVQAAKAWLDNDRSGEGDGGEKPADPLAGLDELAARRASARA